MKKTIFRFSVFLITVIAFAQEKTVETSVFRLMDEKELSYEEIKKKGELLFENQDKGRGSGYKQFQRWLYERSFHLDENGRFVDPEIEQLRYDKYVKREKAKNETSNQKVVVGNWFDEGPTDWNRTSGWNPGHGRLTSLAIHPSNTNIIYVSSPGGGIWKTTNGGNTWQSLTDNNAAWMNVFSLAIDPKNSNTIYAGTANSKVIKSTNGGASWTELTSGPTGKIKKIVVNPSQSNILLVCADNGLWKTYNRGESWFQRSTVSVEDVEYKPGNTKTVYMTGRKAYKSTDWGNNWTQIGTSQGISNWNTRMLVSVTPDNSNYVYIIQVAQDNKTFGKLYRSTNSGSSFSTRVTGNTNGKNFLGYATNGVDTRGQGNYDLAMAVSPTNANEVHIGGINTWKSTNGGSSFYVTSNWIYPNNYGYTHSDIHGLEFINGNLYTVTDGGISVSYNNASDWTMLSSGLNIRQFYRMASAPTNANVFTAGAQDNGSVTKSTSGFRDWLGADGMEGMISPTNVNHIWGTSQFGQLYKSTNGGQSRTNLYNFNAAWVTPMVMHPTNSNIIYAGGRNGVFKSTNGGQNFSRISPSGYISGNLVDLTISPANSNYIYASKGKTIYHSHNGGSNWYKYNLNISGNITDIAANPNNVQEIYVSTNNNSSSGGRIYKFSVGTLATTNISSNIPKMAIRTIAVSDSGNRLFVGSNIGVYASDDTGASWTDITSNLPKVAINEIDIQKGSDYLRVATYGRGIWLYSYTAPRAMETKPLNDLVDIQELENNVLLYPNPTKGSFRLNISKLENVNSVLILNNQGRVVLRQDNIKESASKVIFDISNMPKGLYFVQILSVDGILENIKLLKK